MHTPAKTNFYLTVGSERECDHRHEIRTLFVPVLSLADEVSVRPSPTPGITVECTGRPITGLPTPEDNLAVRAAELFCIAYDLPPAFHISIHKRIPVSAGLGGGSSDAAATLLELRRITGIPADAGRLWSLARRLGADVPYFLNPCTAMATGIGDIITEVGIGARYDLVIAYPGFPSPASWAYQNFLRPPQATPPDWDHLSDALGDIRSLSEIIFNDLQFALRRKFPILEMIIAAMRHCDCVLNAAVSGSGSSCFALCLPGSADAVRRQLRPRLPSIVELL